MFDPTEEIYFCICGEKIDQEGTCGKDTCKENYDHFKKQVDDFFNYMEEEGVWQGFKVFETLSQELQVGILFELEDDLMFLFLQALEQEKVLKLLQSNSNAMRYRFLELLEPILEKEVYEEFRHLEELEKEEIKEFLLQIINIVLQSVQKRD